MIFSENQQKICRESLFGKLIEKEVQGQCEFLADQEKLIEKCILANATINSSFKGIIQPAEIMESY